MECLWFPSLMRAWLRPGRSDAERPAAGGAELQHLFVYAALTGRATAGAPPKCASTRHFRRIICPTLLVRAGFGAAKTKTKRIRHLSTALGIFLPGAIAGRAPPHHDEQYFLEITNRMRLNPQAELRILTTSNPGPAGHLGERPNRANPIPPSHSTFSTSMPTRFQSNGLSSAFLPSHGMPTLADSALFHANFVISTPDDHPLLEAQKHELPGGRLSCSACKM